MPRASTSTSGTESQSAVSPNAIVPARLVHAIESPLRSPKRHRGVVRDEWRPGEIQRHLRRGHVRHHTNNAEAIAMPEIPSERAWCIFTARRFGAPRDPRRRRAPTRARRVERARQHASDGPLELEPSARRWDRRSSQMEVEVEPIVIDPERTRQPERHLQHALPQPRRHVQPRLDHPLHVVVGERTVVAGIEDRDARDVHDGRGLEVEEARAEARKSVGGHRKRAYSPAGVGPTPAPALRLLELDADALVGLALRFRLDHAYAADLATRGDVRAAVGLLVDPGDIDHADRIDRVGDQ